MESKRGKASTFAVLHPAFALTGVLHAIIGALLPSLSAAFSLTDAQSGSLALCYFLGTSLGALICVGQFVRMMAAGFVLVALSCFGIVVAGGALLRPLFFALGIGVGIPMTAVSMYAGRRFAERSAAPLTLLNFSWSLGAFLSPLFAARVLLTRSYCTAYEILGTFAAIAAAACWIGLEDVPEISVATNAIPRAFVFRWAALFAVLTFLEVGIENTTATWLATYALRSSQSGIASAAASSSLYWCGFLASRAISSLVLLRVAPMRVLSVAAATALLGAGMLVGFSAVPFRDLAMLVVGAALAPIFPLLLSRFFARTYSASSSRWLLATCGFGGSVLPWITGWISVRSHSLQRGLTTVPAALFIMLCLLPIASSGRQLSSQGVADQPDAPI